MTSQASSNSPRRVKNFLVQSQNIDYAEIELRLLAHLEELGFSKEEVLNEPYLLRKKV